jgi:hypothetical protein
MIKSRFVKKYGNIEFIFSIRPREKAKNAKYFGVVFNFHDVKLPCLTATQSSKVLDIMTTTKYKPIHGRYMLVNI